MDLASSSRKLSVFAMIFLRFIILWSFIISSVWNTTTGVAQANNSYIRHVRTMETADLGVVSPAGLTFSPYSNAFHIMEARAPGQTPPPFSDLIAVTPFEDIAGSARIDAAIKDPINMAFDSYAMRMLIFQPDSKKLIEVAERSDGQLDPTTLSRYDIRHIAVQDPQGMTVNPLNGHLYILDNVGPNIVRVEPGLDGGFEDALISTIDLSQTGLVDLRGLAFDPSTGHLHVMDPIRQVLYEITNRGQIVGNRELSEINVTNPQGMVFAPSADLTDDPTQMHLYIADSGAVTKQSQEAGLMDSILDMSAGGAQQIGTGNITELAFNQVPAVATADFTASLVQTIYASAFNPPSPDTAGITYLEATDTLLLSDSEVNEMSIFTGDNLFKVSLNGILQGTLTTISFSDEPTGVTINPANNHLFFSDDTGTKRIYELNPGPDGLYDTADDIVTSFATEPFGSGDPEGITFDRWQGVLFIADGVNAEVYRVSSGANGVFDGVSPAGDDQVTHFDTSQHGIKDPEGIAFNDDNGNLYVIGQPIDTIAEFTTSGGFVQTIDISAANAVTPAGLAYAPSSQNPSTMNIYIVDRGIDNNSNPNENDGMVYEMTLPTTTSVPPVANDDSANTTGNNPVTIDVLANDSDQNGDIEPSSTNISCTACVGPSNGDLINEGNGIFTYTPDPGFIGQDGFIYQVCDTEAFCDTATVTINVLEQQAVATIYLGSTGSGNAGGVAFTDEDILAYDTNTGTWSMHFDGSDVSLDASGVDIDAFHINSDGSILLSLASSATLPDIGTIDVFDIVRFIPTSLGENTNGSYELYLDGSDVGLSGEDIDAIGISPDGRITISTRGSFNIGGVSGADEDMLIFNATSLGEVTSGTWEMYLDGSDVGLSDGGNDEDINGTWISDNGDIYMTTRVAFNVESAAGDSADILTCVPGSLGVNTTCTFSLFWDGSANGFAGENIDGLSLYTAAGQSNYQPDVSISDPKEGSTFNAGDNITFNASATDNEDGDLTATLIWESDIDGAIGSGGSFSKADLSPGVHTITATATDSGELSGFDTIQITVYNNTPVLVGAGDIAVCGASNDDETANLLENIPGTVFTLGDNAYPDGTDLNFSECYDPTWGRHKSRTRPAVGNHDYHVLGASGYFNYFGTAAGAADKGYYSYDVGDWHVVVLNSTCNEVGGCDIDSTQGQWLQIDLAANPKPCTLAYWHRPLFASDFNHGNNQDIQDFWEILYAAGADIVLNGHSHIYERFAPQDPFGVADPDHGIREFIVGTGGGGLYAIGDIKPNSEVIENGTHGVLKLSLLPSSYNWEFIPVAGQSFTDSGSASCVSPPIPNTPPIVNDDSASTPEDTIVTIDVIANDSDPDGTLDLTSLNTTCPTCFAPLQGSLVNNGDGSFDYTPDLNFSGGDNFIYEICDTLGSCDTAGVTITVSPLPDPPIANDDSATTSEDTPITLDVSANDIDPDGDLVPTTTNTNCPTCAGPLNGAIQNHGDGTFTYTPQPGFTGSDTFVYEICDLLDACDTATVSLTVTITNDPPVVNDDSATTPEDTPVTIDVLANDSDPDGDLDPASSNTTCAGCTIPGNGTLTNNGNGTFTYTPDADFNGSDSFIYEVCDTSDVCGTASVSITVEPVNDSPVANDDSVTTSENTAVLISVTANDSDPDGDLDLTSTNTACPSCNDPSNGTLINNRDGTFDYTPNPNFIGSDSFTYEICDIGGECDTATVNITVTPIAPTIIEVRVSAASDDAEEKPTGRVTLNSSDLELIFDKVDQMVGMRFTGVNIPIGATIVDAYVQFQVDETDTVATTLDIYGELSGNATTFVNATNNISNRVTTAAFVVWDPNPWSTIGEAGSDQRTPNITSIIQEIVNLGDWSDGNAIALIISGSGKRVAESYNGDQSGAPLLHVEYTTGPPNIPPTANDDSASTPEDTLVSIDVAANDNDPDGSLNLASTNTNCAGCTNPDNGSLTNNGDGTLDYDPNPDYNGPDSFVYEICDNSGACDTATVNISVEAVDDPPIANSDSAITSEDTLVTINVAANDTDPDGDLDPTTANTACATCQITTNGSLINNFDGSFDFSPNPIFNGSDNFVYEICDLTGNCDTADVSITVNPTNDPPVAVDDSATSPEDTSVIIDVAANDGDPDDNLNPATANTTCANGSAGCADPTNGTLINNDDGSFEYTPSPDFNGPDSFVYEICDTLNACDTASVFITIDPVNDPPIAVDDSATTSQDTSVTINVTNNDSDIDGNLIPASVNTTCANGSSGCSDPANGDLVNNGDGSFEYTPKPGFTGVDNFTYEVCDTDYLCDVANVNITVETQGGPISIYYLSSTSGGSVGGVSFADEDILAYDATTGTWSMYFDGSDVGLSASGQELDAFHVNPDGSVLFSLDLSETLGEVGSVDEFDIIKFNPTSLGENTAGSYELYLDGSDVELTSEDIDAIGIAPDGRITISTRGSFNIGGVSGADEDMLIFNDTSLGEITSGTWEMYFDGSDVGLDDGGNDEDINGTWIDDNGDIYMATRAAFNVVGATGDSADIFTCTPSTTGTNTNCIFTPFWDGSLDGFSGENINGISLAR